MTAAAFELDEAAWLEWRRGGIGGSDIGALMGYSDWASPFTVWCDKVGIADPEPSTERQRIGRLLEDALADLFDERTGLYVADQQTTCAHPADSWMRCTVDGFVYESPGAVGRLGGVEFKTSSVYGWRDGIPPVYRAQCQWCMAVTGCERWWLAVLHAGFRFDVHQLEAHPVDQAFYRQQAGEFWHDHVLAKVPPPLDGSKATTDALSDLYPHDAVDPDASATVPGALVREWRFAVQDRKDAQRDEAMYANRIRKALGTATEGFDEGGNRVVTWRPIHVKAHWRDESDTRRLVYHGGDVDV